MVSIFMFRDVDVTPKEETHECSRFRSAGGFCTAFGFDTVDGCNPIEHQI